MPFIVKKHWTKFLPEAGRMLERLGSDQEYKLMQIEEHRRKIRDIENTYQEAEGEITKLISDNWTAEEIEAAKKQSEES